MRRGYKRIVATLASVLMAGSAVFGNIQPVSAQTAEKMVDEENAYSNYKQVCAGGYHSAVVTESGVLYTWGYNGNGQLEDGTTENSLVPIKITITLAPSDYIKSFVKRLYTNILERTGDSEGINTWVKLLMNGTQNGATVSYGFIFSNEFESRGLTNDQKVDIFYATFLNRAADADGRKIWVDALDAGVDLEKIFADSEEFKAILTSFGLN